MSNEGTAGEGLQSELTAAQYVILAENQRKKRALAETKAKYSQLAEENKRLLQEREATQAETYEVTEFLRKELLKKSERNAQLEAQLKEIGNGYEAEVAGIREEAEMHIEKAAREAAQKETELSNKVQHIMDTTDLLVVTDLENQLRAVREFQKRRQEIEEEAIKLREERRLLQENVEKQKFALERNFVEQTSRMKRDFEEQLKDQRRVAEEDIDERLDEMVKHILAQNKQMSHELKLHIEQTDELQQEVKMLEAARDTFQRELELKCELEKGYAKRGAKQSNQLKEAQSKITSLECSMQELLRDMSRQKEEIARNAELQIDDAKAEVEGLRRLVKLKSRDVKNIRRLAQEVLMQRSDVETFLLSTLQMVRKEIERESLQPEARKREEDTENRPPSNAMEIHNLTWPDREKVLRLLFAKITNQAQQMSFLTPPPHSFDNKDLQGTTSEAGPMQPT